MQKQTIDALVASFTWTSAAKAPVATARSRALALSTTRVEQTLSGAHHLDRIWREMPENATRRIAGAPATHYVLDRADLDTSCGFLQRSMAAELARLADTRSLPNIWTALGDHGWDAQGTPMPAPLVCGTIPVDGRSPFSTLNASSRDAAFVRAAPVVLANLDDVLLQKLRAAADLVEHVSPTASRFWRSATTSIAVCARRVSAFSSGSSPELPGRIDLINPQLVAVSIHFLAESLLHEAMHCSMYDLEALHGNFLEGHDLPHLSSPWTGSELDLHTFIHACFVWYGLFHFWSVCAPEEESSRRLRIAALGYQCGDPAAQLRSAAAPAGVVGAIEAMQHAVRAKVAWQAAARVR